MATLKLGQLDRETVAGTFRGDNAAEHAKAVTDSEAALAEKGLGVERVGNTIMFTAVDGVTTVTPSVIRGFLEQMGSIGSLQSLANTLSGDEIVIS